MRIHSLFIPFALAIVSCSPRVIPSFQKTYPPSVSSPQDVVVVENKTVKAVPENAELLGSVRVTDTGFTSKKNGTYENVVNLAKNEAWQAGGNFMVINQHLEPDIWTSNIHRINTLVFMADSAFLNKTNSYDLTYTESLPEIKADQKPGLAISGSIGVEFRTDRLSDQLTPDQKEHLKRLNRGMNLNLDINYIFKSGQGLGLVFDKYDAQSQDNVMLEYQGVQESGLLTTNVSMVFYSLVYSLRSVSLNQKHTILTQIGFGPVFYEYEDHFNNLHERMTGNTLGMLCTFAYGYSITKELSLGGKLSYCTGTLTSINHTDPEGVTSVVKLEKEQREGLNRLGLSVSAIYSF